MKLRSLSIFVLGMLLLLIAPVLGQQSAAEWMDKGLAFDDQGKYDEALKSYDRVIELNPLDEIAWNNKGIALKLLGHTSESDAAFTKAWELKHINIVAGLLGKTNGTLSVEELVQAFKNNDTIVQSSAYIALIGIGKPAVDPLICALKDNDSDVQKWAAASLGFIKDNRAVDPLIQALKDNDSEVRRSAADALGRINDTRAVEPLTWALKDEDKNVQSAAEVALKSLNHAA